MARQHSSTAVRPLGPEPRRSRGRRPVKLIALALFVVGAAAGYLAGLPSDNAASTNTDPTTAPPVGGGSSVLGVIDYSWTEQSAPEFTPRLWAVHTAIEVDGYIYTLITDDIQNRVSRSLWRTADGAAWEPVTLDLGPSAVATDLDSRGRSLVVSGWDGSRPTIWTSGPLGDTTSLTWKSIHLNDGELPVGQLVPVFSEVRTEINSEGEHVVVAAMQYSIDRHDLESADETGGSLPEIAVHESQIWTKIIDAAEEEVVTVVPIPHPITVQPISGSVGARVTELSAWATWTSPDGISFTVNDPIDGLDVAPTVSAFNEGFVATTWNLATDTFDILSSADGTAWEPSLEQLPDDCGNTRPAVVGAAVLLVASDDFAHTCTTHDGASWQVHETQTAVSADTFLWITGNDTGFMALAANSQERAILESADGIGWRRLGFEEGIPIGSAVLAGERVLNVARVGGQATPRPWKMWVGQRLEG